MTSLNDVQSAVRDVIEAWRHVEETLIPASNPYETAQAVIGASREQIRLMELWVDFCDPMMG